MQLCIVEKRRPIDLENPPFSCVVNFCAAQPPLRPIESKSQLRDAIRVQDQTHENQMLPARMTP